MINWRTYCGRALNIPPGYVTGTYIHACPCGTLHENHYAHSTRCPSCIANMSKPEVTERTTK